MSKNVEGLESDPVLKRSFWTKPLAILRRTKKNHKWIRRISGGSLTLAALVLLVFSILPVRQYLDRREDVKEAALTLDAIQNEIAGLKKQVELATDKVIVERRAREDMSLVREGDKLYRLSIDPSDALKLPVDWPLPGLRHLLIGD
ncbi:MAG: cell division protein FtsB [Candidatus Poriferisodalaceae bacterium]|jgi:cell division protein FtsB|nr:septum formation initiator family protein [Acidimicrobiales bacterium]|tara:strand:+ start:1930 stop:2367 length:438 start_codon:yes stop_codon:yes gene_type:complete